MKNSRSDLLREFFFNTKAASEKTPPQTEDKPAQKSFDMRGESEERGRRAPFLRAIGQKQELFRKFLFLCLMLPTPFRQHEAAFFRTPPRVF